MSIMKGFGSLVFPGVLSSVSSRGSMKASQIGGQKLRDLLLHHRLLYPLHPFTQVSTPMSQGCLKLFLSSTHSNPLPQLPQGPDDRHRDTVPRSSSHLKTDILRVMKIQACICSQHHRAECSRNVLFLTQLSDVDKEL